MPEEHEADLSFLNNLGSLRPWRTVLSILVSQSTAGSGDVNPSGHCSLLFFMRGGFSAAVHYLKYMQK